MQVQNNSVEILQGALAPRDDSVREILYFKVRVTPLSDVLIKTKTSGSYQAGLVFRQEGRQKLGVGNAWSAWGYSAYCKSFKFPGNKPGELILRTDRPDAGTDGSYLAPRRDLPKTLVVKVEYVPGADDSVTVWLEPNLSGGATEASQSEKIVTRFKTDMSFDELRLMHRGEGEGWVFDDIGVATAFEDFVPKPLWQRPWFLSLSGVALVAISLGGTIAVERRRARRQMALAEREQAVTAERVRIARDIHDEMGASLTHIMRLSTLARKATPNEPNVELDQIHATSRELTRAMDEIVWAVDPRHDTLESLVDYLCMAAQENLSAAGLRCELEIPLVIPQIQITSRIRHSLFLAFKEAINNVIKHASASKVVFRLDLIDKEFGLILEDDGKGMGAGGEPDKAVTSDRLSSGHGLRNIKNRSQEAGGRAEIECQPGKGTRLTLWIPFSPKP